MATWMLLREDPAVDSFHFPTWEGKLELVAHENILCCEHPIAVNFSWPLWLVSKRKNFVAHERCHCISTGKCPSTENSDLEGHREGCYIQIHQSALLKVRTWLLTAESASLPLAARWTTWRFKFKQASKIDSSWVEMEAWLRNDVVEKIRTNFPRFLYRDMHWHIGVNQYSYGNQKSLAWAPRTWLLALMFSFCDEMRYKNEMVQLWLRRAIWKITDDWESSLKKDFDLLLVWINASKPSNSTKRSSLSRNSIDKVFS